MRYLLDNGALSIHQTLINKFRKCPEQARLLLAGEFEDYPGEAALAGILTHAAIEHVAKGKKTEAVGQAIEHAFYLEVKEGNPWMHSDLQILAIEYMEHFLALGGLDLLPKGCQPETPFSIPYETALWPEGVLIEGHRDLTFRKNHTHKGVKYKAGVYDWKFSDASHWTRDQWNHIRYDVQPTVYAYAASLELGIPIEEVLFTYHVVQPKGLVSVPCPRNTGDVLNLFREIDGLLKMMRAIPYNEGPWPLNPSGWHCGPKWCEAFKARKCCGESPGQWVTDDEWNK